MKKSKKALLWTIVPVLGVSSGVAGAVAGVTNQKTSVDTNNVATSSTATTMATKSSSGVANKLKIEEQTYDVVNIGGKTNNFIHVRVSGSSSLRYEWKINKGEGAGWVVHAGGGGANVTYVTSEQTSTILNWTLRCVITDTKTNESITSEDIKVTTLPLDSEYINITRQPEAKIITEGGKKVTLTTEAEATGEYSGKTVGYQWFEYDSEEDKLTPIQDATSNTYTFTTPSYTTKSTTKKYVCKYYLADVQQDEYLNESKQSIVTIKKDTKETFKVDHLWADKTDVKVGDTITLSVTASSSKTENLKYQWLKSDGLGKEYKRISEESSDFASFKYQITPEDANKNLLFCVLITGIVQDDMTSYFQSGNVEVKVGAASETSGTIANETFANDLSVTSSVTTNQASVRRNFYPVTGINTPTYTVDVKSSKSASELTYKWYYVSGSKKELISGANENVLTTDKNLYETVYKANDKHKVGIVCEIYRGKTLVKTVDQSVNSSFYMTVVITRR